MRVCSNVTEYKLPGGVFKGGKSVFEDLEELGLVFPSEDQFFSKVDMDHPSPSDICECMFKRPGVLQPSMHR